MSAVKQCRCEKPFHLNPRLVVVTGGPGAGKTAVLELVRRRFCSHVAVLPEAASIIFNGGFWRRESAQGRMAAQRAIYHVQRESERLAVEEGVSGLILCDRGTIDGLGYWPGAEESYWKEVNSTKKNEFDRYQTVIHLHTPTAENGYNRSNPLRIETPAEAGVIDKKIVEAWSGHPHRFFIHTADDFMEKARQAIDIIATLVPECCQTEPG